MLGQRAIRMGANLGRQCGSLGGNNPCRPPRTAPWRHAVGLPLPPTPPLDRRRADAEETGDLGLAEPGVKGSQQPLAEVDRVLLHTASVPCHHVFCKEL
jgi:hypothetical protein